MKTADNRHENPGMYRRLKNNSYIAHTAAKNKYAPAVNIYRMTDKNEKTIKRLMLEVRLCSALKYKYIKTSVTKNASVVIK